MNECGRHSKLIEIIRGKFGVLPQFSEFLNNFWSFFSGIVLIQAHLSDEIDFDVLHAIKYAQPCSQTGAIQIHINHRFRAQLITKKKKRENIVVQVFVCVFIQMCLYFPICVSRSCGTFITNILCFIISKAQVERKTKQMLNYLGILTDDDRYINSRHRVLRREMTIRKRF